jgi:hypothetical protein
MAENHNDRVRKPREHSAVHRGAAAYPRLRSADPRPADPHPAGRRPAPAAWLAAALLLLAVLPAAAQEQPASPFFFRLEGLRRYFAWGQDLIPTGVDVTLGYRLPPWFEGVDTILQATVGGGYAGLKTFRDTDYTPNVPEPTGPTADPAGNLEFNSPNLQWQVGIRQGILPNTDLHRNLLEAFLFYRGRYDRYLGGRHYWGSDDATIAAIEASHDTWQADYQGNDARGIFGNSFLAGLAFDDLRFDRRSKAYEGTYAEASVELSPYFPSVMGASDFWRVNFSTKTFWILYEGRPEREKNWLTIYAGSYLSVDYADARRQMPMYVMQSFGGTELRDGLAGSVRGFEDSSWDTQLKVVHNFDLRFNLPVIYSTGDRDLLPGIVMYFDMGYGKWYWGDPAHTPGGFLGSTGIGLFLDLFGFLSVHGYANFPLIGRRVDNAPFALDLELGLHF